MHAARILLCSVTVSSTPHDPAFEGLLDALSDVVRRNRNLSLDIARDVGVPASQVAVIAVLGRLGEVRIAELAAELWVDPSVVSRHIGPLEKAGYVERRPDPSDGRASLLRLSAAGADVLSLVRDRRRDHLELALHDWPTERVATLTDALSTIAVALGELREDPRAVATEADA